MRPLLVACLALCVIATAATSQELRDTIQVTIESPLASVTIAPVQMPLHRGDTIQFTASVVDADGVPAAASLTWATSDSTRLRIDPITGIAVALLTDNQYRQQQGLSPQDTVPTLEVYVLAEPVVSSVWGWFRPDEGPEAIRLSEPGPLDRRVAWSVGDEPTVDIGGEIRWCLYALDSRQRVVYQELGEPGGFCPSIFPPAPGPTIDRQAYADRPVLESFRPRRYRRGLVRMAAG